MIAPAVIRRPVTVTVWLIVSAACVLASPPLLVAGKLASLLTRRRRRLIAVRLILAYFSHELGALVACGLLWVGTGGGRLIGHADRRQSIGGCCSGSSVDLPPRTNDARDRHRREANGRRGPSVGVRSAADRPEPARGSGRHDLHCRPADVGVPPAAERRVQGKSCARPIGRLARAPAPEGILDTSHREVSEAIIERITADLGPRGVLLLFPREAISHLSGAGRRCGACTGAVSIVQPSTASACRT